MIEMTRRRGLLHPAQPCLRLSHGLALAVSEDK
jgi:hypothetical protein